MEADDRLITLVVHTEERALRLKDILEFHDIHVTLEDVALPGLPLQLYPKKVRIPVGSLALGLKILESGETGTPPLALIKMTGMGSHLLIPVDFSPASMTAVRVGFFLAEKFGVEPIILHSYIAPLFIAPESVDAFGMSQEDNAESDAVEAIDLRKLASSQLSAFKEEIDRARMSGLVPDIRFSTTLLEGIPEQVIHEYCKQNHPLMVVMATRGIDKKESDLVGSVTAEVIDSCRVPVFTVPENYVPLGVEGIKRVAMFCTFTPFDVATVRGLMRIFDYPACEFSLIPVSDRPISNACARLEDLCRYLSDMFPTASFHAAGVSRGRFDERVSKVLSENDIQLIIVPNKKSSAFSRFFHPTLAHRILFDRDVPLLVLPV